jgi:hypothetical protein
MIGISCENPRQASILIGCLALAHLSLPYASNAQAAEWEITLPVPATASQTLSPDGSLLAMSDTWGPILIFDADVGILKENHRLPERRLYSLGWSSDMRSLLVGDPDSSEDTAIRTVPRIFDKSEERPAHAPRDAAHTTKDIPGGVHGKPQHHDGHEKQWLGRESFPTYALEIVGPDPWRTAKLDIP